MKIISSKNIYEILDLIKIKPEIYLTSKTITALQNFLNGYLMFEFSGLEYKVGQPKFEEFKHWILSKKLEFDGIGNPYSSLLLQQCNNNEELAFNRFFEYLELFLKERE